MTIVRTILIAKAPRPGRVKTRLIPALGERGAAALAAHLLRHTATTALAADLGPVELCVTPGPALPLWRELGLPDGLRWSAQGSGDLGARMHRAVRRAEGAGERALLIGMDCPALAPAHLRRAAEQLERREAALIPSHDGGYVLLGLRRSAAVLFEGMPWSTARVYAETCRRLQALGWTWGEQPALADIDRPDDLRALPAALDPLRRRGPG
ncbi:MAG: TIGR04282 family arsenosugar biosynthesis glycosyltransferase [Synechococcaceae cyanobacterium]|nr:TIGR04282 family arsenosugar biosynthesis glycosyltransferase [Synechococcaceae cyanobacterium]